ncbi:hypothetical protein GIB67_029436 [Kingdonia uniflora]|uniref:Uncharacterized protein n=1 Tax=Kingdonia uniflora TaxID=39325 RepID=A0A7J7NYM1_9MAGN|nr:hypothetical protein GIB67_029436 [Kingdonia uniflora]
MVVYKWPSSFIKEGDKILRNYIWTGDPTKREGVMLKWDKVCKPTEERGLGIRSPGEVNKAMFYKHYWVFQQGTEEWAKFLKSKFSNKSRETIQYYKPSTLWNGIQTGATFSKPHIGWLIGGRQKIYFWRDTWATDILLMEHIDMPRQLWKKYKKPDIQGAFSTKNAYETLRSKEDLAWANITPGTILIVLAERIKGKEKRLEHLIEDVDLDPKDAAK